MSGQKDNFTKGIYNYCDRWCERCPLTSRCVVYAELEEDFDANHDASQEVFWRNIADSFKQSEQLLKQWAEENEIDLDAADYEEIEKEVKAKHEKIRRMDLTNLAESYATKPSEFIKNKEFSRFVESAERTGAQSVPVAMSVASARKDRYLLERHRYYTSFRAHALIASGDARAPVRSAILTTPGFYRTQYR